MNHTDKLAIKAACEDRKHWVMPWVNQQAAALALMIQGRFYTGPNEAGFVNYPAGEGDPFPVCVGIKSMAPPDRLAAFMSEHTDASRDQWLDVLGRTDILVVLPGDSDGLADQETLSKINAWAGELQKL